MRLVHLHYLWSGPVEALTIIALLIMLTGYAGLIGLGLTLLLLPLQIVIARIMSLNRQKAGSITDMRVQVRTALLLSSPPLHSAEYLR